MSAAQVYALEITAVVEGVEQTFYFSTAPFATGPGDQPAHQPFAPLIQNAGTFARSLFSGKRMTGYVAPSYGSLQLANPTDADGVGELDAWVDYGVSGARVVLRMGEIGAAYPADWELVYIARAQKVSVQPEGMTVSLRDLSQVLDKPVVSDVFTGSGGLEGSGAGLGRKKQFVSSDPGFIPPILIDAAKQIYFVQSSGTWGMDLPDSHPELPVFGVWDNGVPITRDRPNYASAAELLGTAPAAGHARYYFAGTSSSGYVSGPVYLRLGSPPDGDVRVFTLGAPGPDEWERIGQQFGSYSLGVMAIRAGVPAVQVDLSGVNMGAQLIEADQTYLQAMSSACMVSAGYFGFGRDEVFRSGYLCDPDDDGINYGLSLPSLPPQPARPTISLHTFTPSSMRGLRSDPPAGADAPTWKVTISTGRSWPSRIAGGASATLKGWLTREPYYDSFIGYSDDTLRQHPQAERAEVVAPSRDLQNSFSRQLAAARYLYLYGGTPRTYTFTARMSAETLALDLHDVVTLQTPRFGLGAGVKFRIVGIQIDAQAREISFTVWAPGRGVYSGSTSPLDPGTEAWNQATASQSQLAALSRAVIPEFALYSSGTLGSAAFGSSRLVVPEFSLSASGALSEVDPLAANVVLLFHGDSPTPRQKFGTAINWVFNSVTDNASSPLMGDGDFEFSNGSALVLYTNDSSDLPNTGSWCVESILAPVSSAQTKPRWFWIYGDTLVVTVDHPDAHCLAVWASAYSATVPLLSSPSPVLDGAPLHAAVSRDGNTWRLFINGALVDSETWSGAVNPSTWEMTFGSGDHWAGASYHGHMDEIRFTRDAARYTAAFTPPSGPHPNP